MSHYGSQYGSQDGQDGQDEEEVEFQLSDKTKYSLYGIGTLLLLGLLYFFTVFLPSYFIPEAVKLEGIVQVGELNVHLQPVGANVYGSGHYERLIMVGDIHGHYSEFRHLLKKANYNSKKDYLLVLGDFVSKGPDSIKVIEYLELHNIDCVLGNHEYYVLQNYAQFHGLKFPSFVHKDVKPLGFNDDPEFLLAKKLQPKHVKYINKCSLIKKLGPVPFYKDDFVLAGVSTEKTRPGIACHGGLRWDLSLEEQHPLEVMEMRSLLGPYFNESTDDPHEDNAVSWSKVWNKRHKESVVYYGHDARRGLNFKKWSRGVDTGCDRGDQLTAVILWDELDGAVVHHEKVVQVACG